VPTIVGARVGRVAPSDAGSVAPTGATGAGGLAAGTGAAAEGDGACAAGGAAGTAVGDGACAGRAPGMAAGDVPNIIIVARGLAAGPTGLPVLGQNRVLSGCSSPQ
jgi:hypothetical protein